MKIDASITNSVGIIKITDVISEGSASSNSKLISEIVDDFINKNIAQVEVYINSRGGSVFETNEIVNQLNRLKDVTVIVGAIAASAATYILAKFKNKANKNSQFMIHRPAISTVGDVKKLRTDLTILENLTEDYKAVYAAKMGKSVDYIEQMFEKGDYWLTAEQALSEGLIDEISSSTSQPEKLEAFYSPQMSHPQIAAVLPNHMKKDSILDDLVFNPHNVKRMDLLEPEERMEVLYSLFDSIELRTDKDTFIIDIVENENIEKANEWVNELKLSDRKDFQSFYPKYFDIFTKKPKN